MNNHPRIRYDLPPIYVPFKAACLKAGITVDGIRRKDRCPRKWRARAKVALELHTMGYSWVQVANVMCMSDLGVKMAAERLASIHLNPGTPIPGPTTVSAASGEAAWPPGPSVDPCSS